MHAGSEQSISKGLSQGNQTGIGLSDRHGAGNWMALHVPGMQMVALPNDTHGRMLNSVLTMVGQMGTSNGIEMGPTVSGGTGRSGIQAGAPPPAKDETDRHINAHISAVQPAILAGTILFPHYNGTTVSQKNQRPGLNATTARVWLSRTIPPKGRKGATCRCFPVAPCYNWGELLVICFLGHGGVGGSEPRYGYARSGTGHVVQSDLMTESD